MKNLFAIILILIVPCLAFSQSVNYTVKGKIGSIASPAKAYLIYKKDGKQLTDSTEVKEGTFEFKGAAEPGKQAHLRVGNSDYISLYLDGPVTVSSQDSLQSVVIKGGKLNDDNNKLKELLKPTDDKLSAWMKVFRASRDSSEQKKEMLSKERAQLLKERGEIQTNFVKNNPNSPVSIDVINSIGGWAPDIDQVETLFNSLSKEVRESKKGKDYLLKLEKEKAIAIGATAPDFTQSDTAGNPVSLRDFRGKYVLLDFWASWCGPCRAENPNVLKAYNTYKDKNFTVLAVSLDAGENGKKSWLTAIKKDGLSWTHVSDLNKSWENVAAQLYQVKGIPQNFLIKIIARDLYRDKLQKKMEELLDGQ